MCGWTCGSHLDFHGHLSGTCLTPGDDAMPNHSCSRPSWETRRPGGRPHASTPAGRDAGGAPLPRSAPSQPHGLFSVEALPGFNRLALMS